MNLRLIDQYVAICKEFNKQPSFKGMMFFKKAFK